MSFSCTPTEAGAIGCVILVIMLVASMPVGFAMAIAGLIGFSLTVSTKAAMAMASTTLFETFWKWSLTVIPLFVLMGQVSFHAGISRRLFHAANMWLGWLPGGMAMATVGACAGFGAICGSGPATAATMSAVALPEMKRLKYDMSLASGTVASAGGLGMLIPPSVVFIVYAVLTEQSIGRLFIAGIVPGLLVSLIFCITIYILCKLNPALGPANNKASWKERFKSLAGISETIALFILVIGGMFHGDFTPTEAAAIGAAGSLIIAMLRRAINLKILQRCIWETTRTSCMVFTIVAGAMIFGKFLDVTHMPQTIASGLTSLPLPPAGKMAMILLFYLVAGCFIDALALILLTVPIFYEQVQILGYDLVWFGVMIVIVTQMGVISPPVGANVYVVSGIARDIPLSKIFKGSLPFLLALVVSAIILMYDKISLWLPNLMYN